MEETGQRSYVCRALVGLARVCTGAPWTTILVALAVTGLSILAARGLELRTGKLSLIPADDPVVERYVAFTEEFGTINRLLAVVDGKDSHEAAKDLAARLEARSEWVREARAELEMDRYTSQFLHTLPPETARQAEEDMVDNRLDLLAMARDPQVATIFERRARRGRLKDAPDAEDLRNSRKLIGFLLGRESDPTAWTPGREEPALLRPPFVDREGRFVSKQRDKALVIVRPAVHLDKQVILHPFMDMARAEASEVEAAHPGVTVLLTGEPALKADEHVAARQSLAVSSLASLFTVTLLFLVSFRRKVLPLLAVACLLLSLVWTVAWARLSVPYLTVVSTSFIAILIGLGVDFAIHLITHFEEAHSREPDARTALLHACDEVVPGVLTGALTTSAAFFSMLLVGFPAFRGLGVVAGGGILLAVIETFSVLPAALLLWTREPPPEGSRCPGEGIFRWLAGRVAGSPTLGLIVALGVCVLSLQPARMLRFETNLLKMNDPESESMRLQDTFLKDFGFSPSQNALIYQDREAMEEGVRQLEGEDPVSYVDSIIRLVPADPERNRDHVREIRRRLDDLGEFPSEVRPDRERRRAAARHLAKQVGKLRLLELALGRPAAAMEAERLRQDLEELVEADDELLDARERELFKAFWDDLRDLRQASRSHPETPETAGEELVSRYRSDRGRYAIFVAPAQDVRQDEEAQRFTKLTSDVAARTGAEHTGRVQLIEHMVDQLERGYEETARYALIAVMLLLVLDLRRPALVLGVLSVCAMGILALRATMVLHGMQLNAANFIAIPLLLGIGVDNAVHLMHPWLRGESLEEVLAHCGRPVALNAATSILGFGGLVAADHQGLYSLGWVMAAGVFWCMVAAFLIVPGVLHLLTRSREFWRRQQEDMISHRFA